MCGRFSPIFLHETGSKTNLFTVIFFLHGVGPIQIHRPLHHHGQLVPSPGDLSLGLLVGQVEDVPAVDLDQVVAAAHAGLAGHAVQGDLEFANNTQFVTEAVEKEKITVIMFV